MRKSIFFVNGLVSLLLACTASGPGIVIKAPEPAKSLLVGAILVENTGIDDRSESITYPITVIVVGKWTVNGKEKSQGFRIRTDRKGYYAIPNVMPGSYLVKGIEVDVGFTQRMLITSRWEGDRQLYVPEEQMIDFTVRVWPPEDHDRIISLQIQYIQLDRSGRIASNRFPSLENARLGLENVRYTMVSPPDYFKTVYPESGWFE